MANAFAYLVLSLSPLVVVLLFRLLPRTQALVWSVVGGYLFLPLGIGMDLPLLPPFSKELLPVLAAAVMCLLVAPDRPGEGGPGVGSWIGREGLGGPHAAPPPPRGAPAAGLARGMQGAAPAPAFTRQRTPVVRQAAAAAQAAPTVPVRRPLVGTLLLLLLVATPFLTAMRNAEPVVAGPRVIVGLQPYDAFSMVLGALVTVLPLLVARRYLATAAHHVVLLRILCIAGLIYSLPALFEVRMSPHLNVWFYGYFPGTFLQQVRDGGFRPMVFVGHGLRLALVFAIATLAAFALWRHRRATGGGGGALLAGCWLLVVLVFCKSLGALATTLLLLPVVLLAPVRLQMVLAAAVGATVLLYPMLRGAGVIPVERIATLALSVSEQRAQSFQFRIDNEDILLDRANLKPLAGWGSWGRNRVYHPETGADISVTDGAWIIIIGVYGWLGYVAQFGLLTIPTLLLAWHRRRLDIPLATSGLCLVLAVNLLDLIPNSGLTMLTWLIAGAVLGYWERGGGTAEPRARPEPQPRRAAVDRAAAPAVVRGRSGAAVRQSGGR